MALRIDNQIPHRINRLSLIFRCAHEHIDLAVTPTVAGRHAATNLAHHLVGNLLDGKTERRGAFLVEVDLDFWMPALHARFHISKPVGCAQAFQHLVGGLA